MKRALTFLAVSLSLFPHIVKAQSTDCNALARDLIFKNLRPSWSDSSKLLFLSGLTQTDLQSSREALDRSGKVSVGPTSISRGTWSKERQDQLGSELRKIVNVDLLRQSAASLAISSGDPAIAKSVEDCLTSRGGLFVSLYDVGKENAVLELMWISSAGSKTSATIDNVTVVHGSIEGGQTFAREGAELQDRLRQRITIRREDPKRDVVVIVNTKDAGSAQAYLPPSELPAPQGTRVTIVGEQKVVGSGAHFDGGRNPGCQGREAQSCVRPQNGGQIVPGTGQPRIISQSGRAGVKPNSGRESPQEYCVTFWASTGACETPVSITGVATAVEEYSAGD